YFGGIILAQSNISHQKHPLSCIPLPLDDMYSNTHADELKQNLLPNKTAAPDSFFLWIKQKICTFFVMDQTKTRQIAIFVFAG
nr:hypothetical protein [Lachnospiraceae bacterium]